jgi:hypothetical protein
MAVNVGVYPQFLLRYNWTSVASIVDIYAPPLHKFMSDLIKVSFPVNGIRLQSWRVNFAEKDQNELVGILNTVKKSSRGK